MTEADDLRELSEDIGRRRHYVRKEQHIENVMSELFARTGYAREQGTAELLKIWQECAGETLGQCSHPAKVSRGTLQVIVESSSVIQELMFQQAIILQKIQQSYPEKKIQKIKFQVGSLS